MKKILALFCIFVFPLLISCDNSVEVSGIVEYETILSDYKPDYNATVIATKGEVNDILEYIDALRRYDFLWMLKDAVGYNETRYEEIEKEAEITSESFLEYSSKFLQNYYAITGLGVETIQTITDQNGFYSLKLKGDDWNIVYISNNLNKNSSKYYIDVYKTGKFHTNKDVNNVRFDLYKSAYFKQ